MYWPVLRCHQASVSATGGENQATSTKAASTSVAGRSHAGAANGGLAATVDAVRLGFLERMMGEIEILTSGQNLLR